MCSLINELKTELEQTTPNQSSFPYSPNVFIDINLNDNERYILFRKTILKLRTEYSNTGAIVLFLENNYNIYTEISMLDKLDFNWFDELDSVYVNTYSSHSDIQEKIDKLEIKHAEFIELSQTFQVFFSKMQERFAPKKIWYLRFIDWWINMVDNVSEVKNETDGGDTGK